MATRQNVIQFAEQAIKVEGILQEEGVTGKAGRVVFVLMRASTLFGVSQSDVVTSTGIRKDVVNKLVKALRKAGLVTQERDTENPSGKRVFTTDSGRSLLSRVEASLHAPRPTSSIPRGLPLGTGMASEAEHQIVATSSISSEP